MDGTAAKVFLDERNAVPKLLGEVFLNELNQVVLAHKKDRLKSLPRVYRPRLLCRLAAQSFVLRLHAVIKGLSWRASGLRNSLPGHMSKILHFPLRDVDREFLFFQLEQLSKLVSKKTSPRSIDDDNAMGSMLIDEPEELGDRRSSPAEIVVYRDLQGNDDLRWGAPAVPQLLWLVHEHRAHSLVDEPERLGARRSSPAEIVVTRDLQGNAVLGGGAPEASHLLCLVDEHRPHCIVVEPEELGDRRSSPAEIVVYRDLQGNELPGVPSCEDSHAFLVRMPVAQELFDAI